MIDRSQSSSLFSLEGKNIFVVGGGGLIGKEIVNLFRGSANHITILDIQTDSTPEKDQLDNELITTRYFDCSKLEQLEENYDKFLQENCPHVFVNCSYPRTDDWQEQSFESISFDSYRRNIDIHLNSFAWLAKMTANAMKSHDIKGSIIQLGSIYGIRGQDLSIYVGTTMSENMTYSVIKGGVTNLTRQMASYYGQFGIRINTIVAGGVQGHVAGKDSHQSSVFVQQYENRVPMKRMATPKDIAQAALYLSSDASSYVTGTEFVVDGGWSAV